MRKSLTQIFDDSGSDKGSYFCHKGSTLNQAHRYTTIYEKFMDPYRDQNINLLEIGLWSPYYPGASVRAWGEYFEKAMYYGIDIVDCTHLNSDRIKIEMVDQSSKNMLENYKKDKPQFKFIIDDGCHEEIPIIISLASLFPKLESGGIYFIEDLHVVDKTMLYKLLERNLNSPSISEEENAYINQNIKNCYFFCEDKLCVLIKK